MNDLEIILCKLFGCGRPELYLNRQRPPLTGAQARGLESSLKKRLAGEPVQYIVGETEFMGLRMKVKPGVLVPRPETEILVEVMLERLAGHVKPGGKILDLGTGSGNIIIALAASGKLPGAAFYSADISDTCLTQARVNARLNGVEEKIVFLKSDLFRAFQKGFNYFDAVVSNPPYVTRREYRRLPENVLHEPKRALLAGKDGLVFYRRIEADSRNYLNPGGWVFLEIGDGQAGSLREIFEDKDIWDPIEIIPDDAGLDRVAVVRRRSDG